jgi:hypothetical protein
MVIVNEAARAGFQLGLAEARTSAVRKPSRIGGLHFKYEDPSVDVTTEQRTVEQETIDDTVVVQTIGRKPDQITINAIVANWELVYIDALTELGVLSLRTERWSGDVLVQTTDTSFKRAKDQNDDWLYDATITCLEVDRV